MKTIATALIVSSFVLGCATTSPRLASELDRSVDEFQKGFTVMNKDKNQAKENFNASIQLALSAKIESEVSTEIPEEMQPLVPLPGETRSQVLFFSNCYLAYIDTLEKQADPAAQHLETMLENKKACTSKRFNIFPSDAAQVEGKGENTQERSIHIDINKVFQDNMQSMLKCFDCETKAYAFLGDYYYQKRDYSKSAYMLTEFLKGKPKKGARREYDYANKTRAADYFYLGKFKEAIADLDIVLASNPKDPNAYAMRFVSRLSAYQSERNKNKKMLYQAKEDYDKTLSLDPNNALAKEFQQDLKMLLKQAKK